MNIDASLAKAITKFANKKMTSFNDNEHISPIYRKRLEKMISNAAVNGESSISHYVLEDQNFYAFLITMEEELKKEGFKFKRTSDSFLNSPHTIIISWK